MARPKGQTLLHLTCENCGTDVVRRKGQEREHTFCSRDCYHRSKLKSETIASNNAKRHPDAWFTAPCAVCGTELKRQTSRRTKNVFCSWDCKVTHQRSGEKRQLANGYVKVYVGRDYPGATKTGHIFEHRKVMQDHLRRPLLPEENVHHKNGVRDDNRLDNLELWTRSQPTGQRVEDKIRWAREFLALYEQEARDG